MALDRGEAGMSLLLAVETSGARYGLALGEAGVVRFELTRGPDESRELGAMLAQGLAAVGASPADIDAVAVDIGPGSLGSLRDGVSFANGLAYALGRPVYAFTSFELVGAAAHRRTGLPVLCARRANEGLAYAGWYDGARVTVMRHGPLQEIAPRVVGAGRCAVAGSFRDLAPPGVVCVDSGVEAPEARTMIELGVAGRAAADPLARPAFPLTESAGVFRD
jgi:tRNA threonylcarbamoyladenosine biosynthesis protein TsaB